MAPVRFSLTFVLLSGFVVLGTIEGAEAVCTLACVKDAYITCCNHQGERFDGCACECLPPGGQGCVVHLADNTTIKCPKAKS